MMKRHPLATLLAIILFGLLIGLIAGLISFKFWAAHEVSQLLQQGIGAPSEIGDGALSFLLDGSAIGAISGFIVGLVLYLKMVRNDIRNYHIT